MLAVGANPLLAGVIPGPSHLAHKLGLPMALDNVGTIVLNLLIFITTLVNFSYALATLEPLMILGLYAISRIFVTPPETGIIGKCQHAKLYDEG